MVVIVAFLLGMWIQNLWIKPEIEYVDKVVDQRLTREIDSLKVLLSKKDEMLQRTVDRMLEFDSLAQKEKKKRLDSEVRQRMLKEALLERLRMATNNEKRDMILEYYEKDSI
jgi:hypothetical protein